MLPICMRKIRIFYRNMRIQDLAQGIHKPIRQHDLPLMLRAFGGFTEMIMTATQPGSQISTGNAALDQLPWRVSANMILPLSAVGSSAVDARREDHATESRAVLDFLLMLCRIWPALSRF